MKKGFTLIEVLAVIVILAILAIITIPLLNNIIENAKKEAFKSSAYGIVATANLYYTKNSLENTSINSTFEVVDGKSGLYIKGTDTKLDYKGANLKTGSEVLISASGKVSAKLISGDYCVIKNSNDEEITVYKSDCLNGFDGEVNESVLTTDLATLKAQLGSEALTTTSNTITGAINEINTKVSSYDSIINDMNTKVTTIDGKVTSLNTSVSSTGTKVTALESSLGTTNTSVSTLNTKVSALETASSTTNTNVSSLTTRVSTVETTVSNVSGTHYSTTEFFTGKYWIDGKKIYSKTVSFGALPNATTRSVAHGAANVATIWIDMGASYVVYGIATLPVVVGTNLATNDWYSKVDATNVSMTTGIDRSTCTAYITLLYTKTTN